MDKVKIFNEIKEKPDNSQYIIEKGTINDIDELEDLYNDLTDYLASGINYPGWEKGDYPIRETAVRGVQDNNLFVLKINNEIAGSVILNHEPNTEYSQVTWGIEADYKDIMIVHTLAIHPKYMGKGIGRELMDFTNKYCIEQGIKAIRLDVSVGNIPAISLYKNYGYRYVGTVGLRLSNPDLVWVELYELIL